VNNPTAIFRQRAWADKGETTQEPRTASKPVFNMREKLFSRREIFPEKFGSPLRIHF
jgi:hypothetical protein